MKLSNAVRSPLDSEASAPCEQLPGEHLPGEHLPGEHPPGGHMPARSVPLLGKALALSRAASLASLTKCERGLAPLASLSDSVFGGHG